MFDAATNTSLLATLQPDVFMVGLNISRSFSEPFRNFHDPSPMAQDYKLRYAFAGTPFYGAYMTDIVKHVETVTSGELLGHLRANPEALTTSIGLFQEELQDLGAVRPTILAFGGAAHRLVAENVAVSSYDRLIRLTHYSHQVGMEAYRATVLAQIAAATAAG